MSNYNEGKYILNKKREVVRAKNYAYWTQWMQDFDRRMVAQTNIGLVRISTVFLGIDHRMTEAAKDPIVFETMVFPKDGPMSEIDMKRCCTWAEAIEDHDQFCDLARVGKFDMAAQRILSS